MPDGAAASIPDWSYTGIVAWDNDVFSALLLARGFSDGLYDTSFIERTTGCPPSTIDNQTIEDNGLSGAIYFDANISFKLTEQAEV